MMALCQTLGGQPSVIKTLGPQSTDSYNAAHFWCKKNDSKVPIVVYPSFDNLFEQMEANDYIVMPLGYTNRNEKNMKSWVDYHFQYLGRLQIIDIFTLPTMEMIIVENPFFSIDGAIIQSSTVNLLRKYISNIETIDFAVSKSLALTRFIEMSYRYVLCSKNDYEMRRSKQGKEADIIFDTIRPIMLWIVYKVCDNKDSGLI